jgi:signal transduction histidine kinase
MRATLSSLVTGASLVVAVVVVIGVSSAMDLEIEPYALAGVLAGGVVALIPERSAFARLGAFAIGFVASWIGFVLRAALLPDSESGRAVAAVAALAICLVAVAISRTRLPLVAMLVGVALLAAAYETDFVASEAEVVDSSLNAVTALLVAVAVGFAVAALTATKRAAVAVPAPSPAADDVAGNTITMSKVEVAR